MHLNKMTSNFFNNIKLHIKNLLKKELHSMLMKVNLI